MKIRGFLVVLILAVVVVYFIYFAKVGDNKGGLQTQVDRFERTKVELTGVNLETLSKLIASGSAEEGLPDDLEKFVRSHRLSSGTFDAWGRKIRYQKLNDSSFRLTSSGKDGVFDTADDIVKDY